MTIKQLNKILLLLFLPAFLWLYYTYNPAKESFFPSCPLYVTTGYKCPGCGSQRAIHALLHGDIGAAWHHNPLLVILIPYFILAILAEYFKIHLLGKKVSLFLTSKWVIWGFFVVIILYWILRNR